MIGLSFLALLATLAGVIADFKVYNGKTYDQWSEVPYKYLVHLSGDTTCTGSWLGNKHVLTAAHCVCRIDSGLKRAVFERAQNYEYNTEQIPIEKYFVNPDYDACHSKDLFKIVNGFDSAVIKLAKNPTHSPSITVAKVALEYRPHIGDTVVMVGYGIDKGGDTGTYRSGKASVFKCTGKFRNNPICVIPKKIYEARRIQNGDSGGPLIDENNSKVLGTVSGHMIHREDRRYYMMYASTKANSQFIKKYV